MSNYDQKRPVGANEANEDSINFEQELDEGARRRGEVLFWAVVITIIYVILMVILAAKREKHFFTLSLNAQGDFLAGAFGGLAFGWFLVALFLQTLELRQNTLALRNQAQELRNTVRQSESQTKIQSIKATLDAHQQYSFFLSSLLYNAMLVYCTRMTEDSKEELGEHYPSRRCRNHLRKALKQVEEAWRKYETGDREAVLHIFNLRILKYDAEKKVKQMQDVIQGPPQETANGIVYPEARPRFLNYFCEIYEEYEEVLEDLRVQNDTQQTAWLEASIANEIYQKLKSGLSPTSSG
jgi:hypothetical protein